MATEAEAKIDHTPGPWVVTGISMTTGNVSVGAKDQRIIIADVTNAASLGDMIAGAMKRGSAGFHQSDCRTQFANAQLISAAPELLAALKAIQKVGVLNPTNSLSVHKTISDMNKAISKAEGRS